MGRLRRWLVNLGQTEVAYLEKALRSNKTQLMAAESSRPEPELSDESYSEGVSAVSSFRCGLTPDKSLCDHGNFFRLIFRTINLRLAGGLHGLARIDRHNNRRREFASKVEFYVFRR